MCFHCEVETSQQNALPPQRSFLSVSLEQRFVRENWIWMLIQFAKFQGGHFKNGVSVRTWPCILSTSQVFLQFTKQAHNLAAGPTHCRLSRKIIYLHLGHWFVQKRVFCKWLISNLYLICWTILDEKLAQAPGTITLCIKLPDLHCNLMYRTCWCTYDIIGMDGGCTSPVKFCYWDIVIANSPMCAATGN